MNTDWLDQIKGNSDGLIPARAQDWGSGRILMQAWINREALQLAVEENRAVYWSRSKQKLWKKGEESGHIQVLHGVFLDCDNDCVVFKIEQLGGIACHTGRESCYYQKLEDGQWVENEPVLKDPKEIYSADS